jgi:hypothetical protein
MTTLVLEMRGWFAVSHDLFETHSVTPLDDDGHATILHNIRGNPPSLPPHRPSLRNREPQTYRPRSYVRRSLLTTTNLHAGDRLNKLTNTFPSLPDVLVCSTRPVPRLTDLRADELTELMHAVQRVGHVVERAYKADGLTIACQVIP